jgi:hypothetical protein
LRPDEEKVISENSQFEIENAHKITLHEEFYLYNQTQHTKSPTLGGQRVGLASQGFGSENDLLEVERNVGNMVMFKELGGKFDAGFEKVIGVV